MTGHEEARPGLAAMDGRTASATVDDSTYAELVAETERIHQRYFGDGSPVGAYLVDYACECVESGKRFSVAERCSWLSFHDVEQVNHDHVLCIARWLVEMVPECEGLIERRKSRFDLVFERPQNG